MCYHSFTATRLPGEQLPERAGRLHPPAGRICEPGQEPQGHQPRFRRTLVQRETLQIKLQETLQVIQALLIMLHHDSTRTQA